MNDDPAFGEALLEGLQEALAWKRGQNSPVPPRSLNPDDAPELTDEFFAHAELANEKT